MRIGIDAHMLGDKSGGNESFYRGILDAMDTADGNEYYLFVRPGVDAPEYADKFKIVSFESEGAFKRNFVELPKLCRKYELDVLHTQYYIPFVRPCPVVCTIHDISFEHYNDIFNKGEYIRNKILIPYAARHADKVVTVSEFCRKDIADRYRISKDKIDVIYNAVNSEFKVLTDTELAKFKVRNTYEIGDDPYLICVGNLQPRKNIPRLIRAFTSYKAKEKSATKLVVVGKKAWMFDDIFKEVGERDDVIFTGYVPREDLIALINEAQGFIYPSYFEGFGIPPLEALACGTPVCVSDIEVMHEVLGDKGIFFDPFNEDGIAKALDLVMHTDKTGISVTSDFSWEDSARKLQSIYLETGTK